MNNSAHSVLVVDDNRMNRLKMLRALKTENYDLHEAPGGQEAIEILQSQAFDLVLLDILMPDIDGFQVLEQMQADQRLAEIPVVMVSAVDEQEAVEKCLAMGAVDFIAKSSDAETLKNRVKAILEGG